MKKFNLLIVSLFINMVCIVQLNAANIYNANIESSVTSAKLTGFNTVNIQISCSIEDKETFDTLKRDPLFFQQIRDELDVEKGNTEKLLRSEIDKANEFIQKQEANVNDATKDKDKKKIVNKVNAYLEKRVQKIQKKVNQATIKIVKKMFEKRNSVMSRALKKKEQKKVALKVGGKIALSVALIAASVAATVVTAGAAAPAIVAAVVTSDGITASAVSDVSKIIANYNTATYDVYKGVRRSVKDISKSLETVATSKFDKSDKTQKKVISANLSKLQKHTKNLDKNSKKLAIVLEKLDKEIYKSSIQLNELIEISEALNNVPDDDPNSEKLKGEQAALETQINTLLESITKMSPQIKSTYIMIEMANTISTDTKEIIKANKNRWEKNEAKSEKANDEVLKKYAVFKTHLEEFNKHKNIPEKLFEETANTLVENLTNLASFIDTWNQRISTGFALTAPVR
ncbi:MAG: hypothetical protein JXQ76_11505 [Campylobacterales bacterium]|nr:hypothetical protein [Campylobacterales bacterium]